MKQYITNTAQPGEMHCGSECPVARTKPPSQYLSNSQSETSTPNKFAAPEPDDEAAKLKKLEVIKIEMAEGKKKGEELEITLKKVPRLVCFGWTKLDAWELINRHDITRDSDRDSTAGPIKKEIEEILGGRSELNEHEYSRQASWSTIETLAYAEPVVELNTRGPVLTTAVSFGENPLRRTQNHTRCFRQSGFGIFQGRAYKVRFNPNEAQPTKVTSAPTRQNTIPTPKVLLR
ncbi:hypothetical protein BJ508DRAFT_305248 [Ascobolus immersus RN42]|uniref:Uncharacterized protein n=1 Tax=Ascobolus immersus RN42 TaxID=1160509 RepID=A0A3N4IA43_ASCIM|nr:hypothetical protein BJ508DRAFT_305248 [Ascobolus immersus RN42]